MTLANGIFFTFFVGVIHWSHCLWLCSLYWIDGKFYGTKVLGLVENFGPIRSKFPLCGQTCGWFNPVQHRIEKKKKKVINFFTNLIFLSCAAILFSFKSIRKLLRNVSKGNNKLYNGIFHKLQILWRVTVWQSVRTSKSVVCNYSLLFWHLVKSKMHGMKFCFASNRVFWHWIWKLHFKKSVVPYSFNKHILRVLWQWYF